MSTSRVHRNNNNSCNNIISVYQAHFFLSILSIYVNTILHIIIIIRIIIIMFYNYNNFLSKKSRDKPIYA